MKIIGKAYDEESLPGYIASLKWTTWEPKGITIHHCAAPSLAQRPNGFLSQHMLNLQDFYEGKGWSSGPHIFTDEDQAWIFSPLTSRGVHAVSFNSSHIGIEMLGDYDTEDPWSGRGLEVLRMTAFTAGLLIDALGLKKDCINFHRDDIKTSKTCPGKKILKSKFLELID